MVHTEVTELSGDFFFLVSVTSGLSVAMRSTNLEVRCF